MKNQLISIKSLSCFDRSAMYALLSTHFEGVRRDVFEADLAQKNWVILLKDQQSNQLKGFSTLLIYSTQFDGEILDVVYSGDTIVEPSAWSSSILSRTWIASVNQLRSQDTKSRLYWLLISSGYRTYRFLPVFWQEFYPRYERPTPAKIQGLIEFLAQEQFGKYYDRKTGIVRFPHPHYLSERLKGIPPERLKNPHIQFFASQNPGYLQGDELVCLTEICQENLTKVGKRMWFANSHAEDRSVGCSN